MATLSNELSVRLHVSLLEIIGELVEVLIVGEKELSLGTVEIVVPETDDSQDYGKVLLQRGFLEVLVHAVSTLEELLEVLIADNEGDRQSDGTPEGVTSTDPVPKLEHVLLGDTEGSDSLGVRTEGDEMFGNVGLIFGDLEEPVSGTLGVGDRLLSGEGLASNDEERCLRVAKLQGLGEVSSVYIGDEVGCKVPLGVSLESLSNHDGTQIGTADADVDDGVDGPSRVSLPSPVPNGVCELLDVLEHGRNLTGTLLADLELVKVTESYMKDGTILGGVDMLSREHLVPVGLDLSLAD